MHTSQLDQGHYPVINQRRLSANQFSEQMKTVILPGKYFIQVAAPSRDLEYLIHLDFLPKPLADFNYSQVNNSVLFENLSIGGIEYLWEFGDENQRDIINPLYEYKEPGVYDVCLTVNNEAGFDQKCDTITIKGVSMVSPTFGGNISEVFISAYGGGLDTFFMIKLEKDGDIISTTNRTGISSRNSISGILDLTNIEPGIYNVVVEKEGGPLYSIKDGFEVVEGIKADPWIRIIGRDRILFNTPSSYSLEVGNNGNVDAQGVISWLLIEDTDSLEIEFVDSLLFTEHSSNSTEPGNIPYVLIDTTDGYPYKARVYSFVFPLIPHSNTISYPIKIKTDRDLRMVSWTEKPMFRSPLNESKSDCIAASISAAGEEIEEITPFECVVGAVAIAFEDLAKGLKALENLKVRQVAQSPGKLPTINFVKFMFEIFKLCGHIEDDEEREAAVTFALRYYLIIWTQSLETVSSSEARISRNTLQIDQSTCKQESEAKNIAKKSVKAVNNFDPNEKVGPIGYKEQNYFREAGNIPFQVYYENKDFATAPVHVLKITDQLDISKYDLSTFSFGRFTIADSTWYPEPGLKEFFGDYYLAEHEVIARVYGKLDTITGEIYWEIRSLDPITLTDIEDPDIGFLPPNKTSPEGEGMFSFSVNVYVDLIHGDEITNDASIIFDANQPLVTNTYKMTLDQVKPESQVNPLSPKINLTQFDVDWGGHDDDSGMAYYDVYYSIDQDTFQLWLYHTTDTLATFYGEENTSYQFYSIGYDLVGNVEEAPSTWDAETFISTSTEYIKSFENDIQLFPNPCRGMLNFQIESDGNEKLNWNITNALGSIVMQSNLKQSLNRDQIHTINLTHLPEGIYFINIQVDGLIATRKFVLIHE